MFKRRKPDMPPAADPAPMDLQAPAPYPTRAGDSGLGVPPFRPSPTTAIATSLAAPMKEAPTLSRPQFPAAPAGQPNAAAAGARPASGPVRPSAREPAERRTLVVGRGISVQGTVQDAERLVVEGTVEATMIHAHELLVALGGVVKGEIEVEEAEIAGTIDGTLTARGNLIVRSTGRVLGVARCRRLQVEDGGQITGRMEMITEPRTPTDAPRPTEPTL